MRRLIGRWSGAYRSLTAGRAAWLDAGLGLALALLGLAEAPDLGLVLPALLLGVALALRRRWPLAAYLVAFAIIVETARWLPFASLFGAMIAAYSLAAYGRSRVVAFGVLFASASFVSIAFHGDLSFLPQPSVAFVIIGTCWLAGNAIRSRQAQADASEERAARLEREQRQAQQIAIAQERARIARELHDVVTHHVSVMVVQAGAARHVMQRSPAQAEEALLAVEARGREALAELRGFLGVIDGRTQAPLELAPQPGTGDIEELVRGVAEAGLPVHFLARGARPELPHGIDLAAYRVVQEALTNALKYASGSPTEVVVDYRPDEIRLEVLDQGSGRGPTGVSGRGLSGLRERLAVYGGRLEVGRRPSGGFAVRATIPIPAEPAL